MKRIFKHALIIFIILVFSGISINGEAVNDNLGGNTVISSIKGETNTVKIIETVPIKEVKLDVNKMNPFAGLLDINNARLQEFYKLPIDKKIAYNMWYYREFHSYYTSFYDLMNIKDMDVETFLKLKNLIY
ncbi:helix-hairpin-helix domain-containing protein, partial [bacterium]|nr:helix-hairpin-helix domain-containing protein [bacterium]